ncbi:unnamed protein product [Cuscuta campestris]|uniref:Retroviral polymerase SH3-like domain-containing protein n=1 Tax=Cuscuta campestris TaxID=132261 RepID=A0A484MNN7_9ASTE|nr:unnamed protein product [Cuscuta campestris]
MNLLIVLNCERKLYILETDPLKTPDANARASELTSFKKYEDDARDVNKLGAKSDKVIFGGYPKETRGYEFYHPSNNKIFVARNGTFLEKEFLSAITSGRKVDLEEIREPQEEVPIVLEPEQRDQAIEPQIAQDIPRSMSISKKRSLPMTPGTVLSKSQSPSTPEQKELMMKVPYASAIGSIMYTMICTRPDVSFALSVTSRYQGSIGEAHSTAVKNILKYLRNTKDAFLVYGGEEELKVVGYTDASFQTDRDDSKSQAGYLFCLNGGAFSWKSFKEDTTAIRLQRLSTYLLPRQLRKLFGSRSSLLNLEWFLVLMTLCRCFATTLGPLHKHRNRDLTRKPNIWYDAITSYEKS